ncbi:MAG: acyl-CoA dehydrogenase [Actinobacteria bacterium]|nr:acyl-CoA dehydrogenase [Actinomycetota bacterium]MTB27403.1 acyl-CoA dehydrogenase [Actinomycetota bacterium]
MSDQLESVEDFRIRARAWLSENMPKLDPAKEYNTNRVADREWVEHRALQKKLFAGGFAGICFPKEYGGQGLSPAHQAAFTEESVSYEMPLRLNVPSLSICSGMLLDMGSEEQKQTYLRGAISGEMILCQFLSEPSGGSDLAGLLTRAQRDGDTYIINGQKCWSTFAYAADFATCLVRTDWDAPKHRGLSMIIVPVHDDATHLQRVRMVDGSEEFCEEFFTDLVVPAGNLVGTENDGWTVGQRQLFYERQAVGGGSPYVSGQPPTRGGSSATVEEVARAVGKDKDPATREIVGWQSALDTVNHQLIKRITVGMASGEYPAMASSMMRLAHAEIPQHKMDVMLDIAGDEAVTSVVGGDGYLRSVGVQFLMRQGASLGGGSSEMSRNMISERVLMMPREMAADRDVPFREVRRGR